MTVGVRGQDELRLELFGRLVEHDGAGEARRLDASDERRALLRQPALFVELHQDGMEQFLRVDLLELEVPL